MEYYFASLFYSCTVYVESRCYGEGKCSSEVTDQDSNGVSQPARTTVLSLTQMQRQFFFFVVDLSKTYNVTVFTLGFFLTLAKPLSYFEIVHHLNYCHSSLPMLSLLCHLHTMKVVEAISFIAYHEGSRSNKLYVSYSSDCSA